MRKLTLGKLTAVVATFLAASTTIASAVSPMPLSSQLRACDFSPLRWVPATGGSRIVAQVSSTGSTVVAQVNAALAPPDTRYDVRVIQTPRPSIGCAPGDDGVVTGSLQIDGAGNGTAVVTGPIASGKTGAWVIVELPAEYSRTPAEFYTTEFIAAI